MRRGLAARANKSDKEDHAQLRLRSLGGNVASEDMLEHRGRVAKLSPDAAAALWEVLGPCVLRPMDDNLAQQLSRFCLHFELAEADLGHIVRVARWLLHEAASLNLAAEHFAEDLTTLWPEHDAFRELLSRHFDEAKGHLRNELLSAALLKHGAVLDHIDWRVDRVMGDTRAPRLDLSVALVTFAYRDRSGPGHCTLQMTSEQLQRASQVLGALAQQTERVTEATQKPAAAKPTAAAAQPDAAAVKPTDAAAQPDG